MQLQAVFFKKAKWVIWALVQDVSLNSVDRQKIKRIKAKVNFLLYLSNTHL